MPKSGFVAIIGCPNVGKSTLLNAFLKQKIAAVSPKPQTTRHRILGISHFKSPQEGQILFLDTPGIHRPHKSLNEYMMEIARESLSDADLVLFLIEPKGPLSKMDKEIYGSILKVGKPVAVLINKIDQVAKLSLLALMDEVLKTFKPDVVIPVSAQNQISLEAVESWIQEKLPEGPLYYPKDQVTDQSERFLVSESIREKLMRSTKKEIPYAVTVLIDSFLEPKPNDPKQVTRIQATIIIEKESQKAIVIGHGGQMLKKIGTEARMEMEKELERKIFLELFVRVEKDWSQDPNKVKEFAYS